MFKPKQEVQPIQPVAVVSPIETVVYSPPVIPTWIEVNILMPLEKLSERFLASVIILGVLGMILELVGLLP